jgi:hypothetical protein
MLISGTVVIMVMGGALTAAILAALVLVKLDKRYDANRRHWRPAKSAT